MAFELKNFAFDELAAAITTTGQTTLTVDSATPFPTSGDFMCVLWGAAYPSPNSDPDREIVKVTGVSGAVFTITRGEEDTTADTWAIGDNIALVMTAGVIDDIYDAIADAGLIPTYISSATNPLVAGNCYMVDSSSSAFTGTLPAAPTDGDIIGFVDDELSWHTNNFTIGRNGKSIIGDASNLICDKPHIFTLIYKAADNDWRLFS